MESSKQGMWKGYHLSIEDGIRKGYLFREKWYIKGKGLDFATEPLRIKICWVPPHTPGGAVVRIEKSYLVLLGCPLEISKSICVLEKMFFTLSLFPCQRVIFEILNIKISLKAARNGDDPSWFFFFQYLNTFFEMTLLIICPWKWQENLVPSMDYFPLSTILDWVRPSVPKLSCKILAAYCETSLHH